jgi:hypothetical protein
MVDLARKALAVTPSVLSCGGSEAGGGAIMAINGELTRQRDTEFTVDRQRGEGIAATVLD